MKINFHFVRSLESKESGVAGCEADHYYLQSHVEYIQLNTFRGSSAVEHPAVNVKVTFQK